MHNSLVIITSTEVLRVLLLDLLVRQTITYTGIKLIKSLPLLLTIGQMFSRLDGAAQRGGPQRDIGVANRFPDEVGQALGVCESALGQVGVTANLTRNIELRLSMLHPVSSRFRTCTTAENIL